MTKQNLNREEAIKMSRKLKGESRILGAFGEELALALLDGSFKRKRGIDIWWPAIQGTVEVKTSRGTRDGLWEGSFTYRQRTEAANALFFCLNKNEIERIYLLPNQVLPLCLQINPRTTESKWEGYRLI